MCVLGGGLLRSQGVKDDCCLSCSKVSSLVSIANWLAERVEVLVTIVGDAVGRSVVEWGGDL